VISSWCGRCCGVGDEVRPGTEAVPFKPGLSVRPELIVMPGSTERKAETPKLDDK
jgi:hypothetical protein